MIEAWLQGLAKSFHGNDLLKKETAQRRLCGEDYMMQWIGTTNRGKKFPGLNPIEKRTQQRARFSEKFPCVHFKGLLEAEFQYKIPSSNIPPNLPRLSGNKKAGALPYWPDHHHPGPNFITREKHVLARLQ